MGLKDTTPESSEKDSEWLSEAYDCIELYDRNGIEFCTNNNDFRSIDKVVNY